MTKQRLTDEQITATVDAMQMPQQAKDALRTRALAGNSEARFAVYGAWRRHNGVQSSLYQKWLAQG